MHHFKLVELRLHRLRLLILIQYVRQVSTERFSYANPFCFSFFRLAQLVVPGPNSFVYKYKTEVKLSVANSQFDIKSEISAEAHIKSLSDCNYALQVKNFVLILVFYFLQNQYTFLASQC